MYDTFEADVMDDLFYEPEGPSPMGRRQRGTSDSYDDYDFYGEDPPPMRRQRRTSDSYDDYDVYDEFDLYDDYDAYDEFDAYDAFEDEMAYALGMEDGDEFLRRLARGARRAVQGVRRAGQVVGRVARVVAPIASAIPLPQAQAIGRVAQVAGRLLADGADEFEAFETFVDLAEQEDLMDAAAPAIASTAIHNAMPQAARLPQATRQELVRATAQTAQTIARRQGTQAVRTALPAVVQRAQRTVRQQGLPARTLPSVIRRIGTQVSQNPQMIRRLIRSASPDLRRQICTACGSSHVRPVRRRV